MRIFSMLTRSGSMRFQVCLVGMLLLALPSAKAQTPYQGAGKSLQIETLVQGGASWDMIPYKAYPCAPPQLTVLKITLPPNSTLPWHTHGIPVAAYVLSGKLTIEKKSGEKNELTEGQAVLESINSVHRGKTGNSPAVLIVFYAGALGLPLAETVQR